MDLLQAFAWSVVNIPRRSMVYLGWYSASLDHFELAAVTWKMHLMQVTSVPGSQMSMSCDATCILP